MSTNKKINTPDAVKAGTGGKKKEGGGNVLLYILVGAAILALIIGLNMRGKEEPKKSSKEQTNTSVAQAANVKAAKVYDQQSSRKIERTESGGVVTNSTEAFSNMTELEYMTEPETQASLVKTSTGYVLVNSPEGQKFISDFNAYQAALNPNKAVAQPQISEEKLNEIREESNNQVRALDEKINELSSQVDGLISVVKKQNETIAKLSTQIKTIQPMVKTPEELATALFGKNGKKVLNERNNALVADVVVGDKAFITDSKGDVHIVRVGDVIPGTSSIVALIDEVSKQVVLKR